jgi:chromosome segregation protein
MYLSKLEIVGFKSFAQKVNLNFDSGISAIVGPNGCGKSNIVDAIRWVLGEQRYSTLRSEKMEDVIFNGTKNRKALGMAEASLVIENTRGVLPSEYTQVTVGRRVYRSGESEYLLNKVPCRLKDILDLFMDTGMGSDAYSVIELKMVETILSDRTDERRRLFEEASGVTKYKHRRKAAYRKLESVQADLVRVNDIVAEVQKAVNSLERQAKKAGQYNELKDGLQRLEIDLMEREYAQLFERMEPLQQSLGVINADRSRIDVDLAKEEERSEALRSTSLELEQVLAQAQREIQEHLDRIHREEQSMLVAEERLKSLHNNIARFESEREELEQERFRLGDSIRALRERIESFGDEEERIAESHRSEQEKLHGLETRVEALKTHLRALNDQNIDLVHRIAEAQAGLGRKQEQATALAERAEECTREAENYHQQIVRIEGEIEQKSADDALLRRRFSEAEVQFYNEETRKKELEQRILDFQRQKTSLMNDTEVRVARVDFLKGLLESREGLSEGVRFLSTSDQWKPSRNLTVADAVNADERFRTAVETALGEFAGLLVVSSREEAEQGIALLMKEGKGKAAFVCLDELPRIETRVDPVALPGVYGWAAGLVKHDPEFAPLLSVLLDRTLIVENTAAAAHVVRQYSGVRCVTLNGEVISGSGVVRGGSRRQDEGGTIGKRTQIEELESEIQTLRNRSAIIEQTVGTLQADLDRIDLRSHNEAVKAIEKEMNGVEISIAQLQFEKKRAQDIIAQNAADRTRFLEESGRLDAECDSVRPSLEALRNERSVVEDQVRTATEELRLLEQEWNTQAEAVKEVGIRAVTLRGDRQNTADNLGRAEERLAAVEATVRNRTEDIRVAHEESAQTRNRIADVEVATAGLRTELAVREEHRTAKEKEAADVRNEIHSIELRVKDERRSHDDSMEKAHDLEMKIADLNARATNLRMRAEREFELVIERKTYPDGEFVDFAALRDEIQVFRDKLKTLGNVNFAAFEEYQEEKQRLDFLTEQRNDLLEAEKTLLQTIEEINTTAQKKFLDTFDLIRKNFIETFKSLFDPGDECDLILEEGVDPLEGAIDIIAKPRGKRPTSIHLLSGGEKTLTATALLFAIYLVKPSPFCILDEVDAPLDDANIDRVTRILRKFSTNTQFIVVTHNKRTMEAANALYGVTMEEEGVSKLVAVRFNKEARVNAAALVSE